MLFKNMDSDNQEYDYFVDDDEYRVYCVSGELCIERFYKNCLKSGTHTKIIRMREQSNN